MKGQKIIMCISIMIILIFANTLVYLKIEPYHEKPKYPDAVIRPEIFRYNESQRIPDNLFPGAYHSDDTNISNMLQAEYINKWYGDEIGFNNALILSCRRLTYGGIAGGAAFSPDGKKIIYSSKRDGGCYSDIWMMDIDGTNHTQLTFEDISQSQPSFLSDGNYFMYVTPWGPGIKVWVKSLLDNSSWYCSERGSHPSPAPGNKIIFVSNGTVIADMYFNNFTVLPESDVGFWPHMDAKGNRVASENYFCNHYNQLQLYDVNSNITTHLTFNDINHNDPAISPDGNLIVYDTYYSYPARNYSNLWLYDIVTDQHYRLTKGQVVDAMAEFSPDGSKIVFGSTRGNEGWSFDLWLITLGSKNW